MMEKTPFSQGVETAIGGPKRGGMALVIPHLSDKNLNLKEVWSARVVTCRSKVHTVWYAGWSRKITAGWNFFKLRGENE